MIENGGKRIAIEIDDDASHLPGYVSQQKHYDDLTKQNSMIHLGWDVYRWPVRVMQDQPDRVKDEMRIFLEIIRFSERLLTIYRLKKVRHLS